MVTMRIATFSLDVTPPVGAQMAYEVNTKVDTPIFIRGLLVEDGTSRAVIVSCDYIGIYGRAWHEWREAVAQACETPADLVFLHSIHQHDSMRIAPWMNEFMRASGTVAVDDAYCETTLRNLQEAASDAVRGRWQTVDTLMTAEARMSGLASSRRMIGEDGKSFAGRFSMCDDRDLQAFPVGTIDPFLRTIAFARSDGHILAAVHTYACHPMAAYMRQMVSQDVPGVALAHARASAGEDVFQMYLTGCAGDVSFGKYHLGDKEKTLAMLGRRLGDGMIRNLARLDEKPIGPVGSWTADFEFPLDPAIAREASSSAVEEADDERQLMRAAFRHGIAQDWDLLSKCPVSLLSLGDHVHLLSMPGEACVEYQLYAQSLVPERFLACAAYSDVGYAYIPTASMYEEGGYEPRASIATPEVEARLKSAVRELVGRI